MQEHADEARWGRWSPTRRLLTGIVNRRQGAALPERPRVYHRDALVSELKRRAQSFVTFIGFGELGYEDEGAMRSLVRAELDARSRVTTIINTGTLIRAGFHAGIADVYREARAMGFRTTGIHPSVALRDPGQYRLSPFVDEAFFVKDDSWGGCLVDTGEPSPTLEVLLAVSGEVLAIGGGRHTADEVREFVRQAIPVRFHEAEMNHAVARARHATEGTDEVDFRGEARHFPASKRGFGNLRRPRAPVDVPKARSQGSCRSRTTPLSLGAGASSKSQAGSR